MEFARYCFDSLIADDDDDAVICAREQQNGTRL